MRLCYLLCMLANAKTSLCIRTAHICTRKVRKRDDKAVEARYARVQKISSGWIPFFARDGHTDLPRGVQLFLEGIHASISVEI